MASLITTVWVITWAIAVRPVYLEIATSNPLEDSEKGTSSSTEIDADVEDILGAGWSAWSSWSECSRSCNGGVTYQLRKCEKKSGCHGEDGKYRICNMQPCPDMEDFRGSQCSAYNQVSYRGRLYQWLPYQDPEDPCSLTCHAKGYSFVAKLAPMVKDGTRCREGSLDMCVDGKCLAVGCDLQLGSNRKVDECGVCGGDGSTCRRPLYVWSKTPFSSCSVSCGGGYQMSRPTCLNKVNDKEVDERLCDVTLRPRPQIKECNIHQCPPVWVTDSWSPCSASCGGGRQSRQVHCAQMGSDGIRTRITMELCLRQKPLTERPCNLMPCPQWISGPWSGCSVTCGHGHKTRSVACQDAKGHHSEDCDVEAMPATKQDCDSGLICTPSEDPGTYLFSDIFKGSQEDAPPLEPYHNLPWKQKLSPVSTEPSYVAGEWGSCSVTCGQGFRKRKVDCKIFLEFSRTVAKLPDKECPGPRPPDMENCFPRPCSLDQNKPEDRKNSKGYVGIEVTYSWRMSGYTPCSASCLGGIRESVIQCVRDHDQAVVMVSQCDISKKPDAITQTCNDHPCPPKWNVSDYTPCSKQCGGGFQTRIVQCLHEVTRGAGNTLVVANDLCPQPPPRDKQFCNVFNCPTRWKTEAWSKCSRSCGGGEKTRKIRCMRESAFGHVEEFAPSSCSKRKPKTQKPCNAKACPRPEDEGDFSPQIYPSHQTYVQERPQRRVFLKVGGTAIVFAGTNLKIRCPSRKSNKTNIFWYRNDDKISSTGRMKISMKGALRIRKIAYKDSGKYTCVSGSSKADLYISVKPLPTSHGLSEEDKTVQRPIDIKPSVKSTEEVYSHERFHTSTTSSNELDKSHLTNNKFNINRNKPLHPSPKSHEDDGRETLEELDSRDKIAKTNGKTGQTVWGTNNISKQGPSKSKFDSSTQRIPLYILAQQNTTKRPTTDASTSDKLPGNNNEVNPDSDEFVPRGGSLDKTHQVGKPHPERNEIPINNFPISVDSWEQKYDGSRRKPTPRPYDTWERNHGGALFSDQESGELNVGTPHHGKGFPNLDSEHPASSGASSNHGGSHIQQLLVNLHHTLGGGSGSRSKSHPVTTSVDVHDVVAGDDSVDEADNSDDSESFLNPSRFVANSFVLGKGKAENLQFEWVIGDWSACSQSCGGSGFKVRASQCLVRLNNVSKTVDSSLCEDAGLKAPETVQSCGSEDCPHWETAPWSQCLESQCFTWHSSYQKRAIYCRTANGTDLTPSQCDDRTRPRRKRECYNERCRSTWKVGDWSECTASCSRQGFQSRILQCVWFGSTKPAGNACRDQPRPIVMRPCTGPPCISSERGLH